MSGGILEATHDDYHNDQLGDDIIVDAQLRDGKKRKSGKKKSKPNLKQKKHPPVYDAKEERALENIIFGDRGDILSKIDSNVNMVSVDAGNNNDSSNVAIENHFFIVDKTGDSNFQLEENASIQEHISETQQTSYQSDDGQIEIVPAEKPNKMKKPAWEDEDDDIHAESLFKRKKYPKAIQADTQYKDYLEHKFNAIFEPPTWAQKALEKTKAPKRTKESISESSDHDSEDDLAKVDKTARDYMKKKRDSKWLDKDFLMVKKCTHLNQTSKASFENIYY